MKGGFGDYLNIADVEKVYLLTKPGNTENEIIHLWMLQSLYV